MKNVFNDEFIAQHGHPDVIITDPPRDGMHKDVVEQIMKIAPNRVVYVSCNSATQARDLALMDEKYKVVRDAKMNALAEIRKTAEKSKTGLQYKITSLSFGT